MLYKTTEYPHFVTLAVLEQCRPGWVLTDKPLPLTPEYWIKDVCYHLTCSILTLYFFWLTVLGVGSGCGPWISDSRRQLLLWQGLALVGLLAWLLCRTKKTASWSSSHAASNLEELTSLLPFWLGSYIYLLSNLPPLWQEKKVYTGRGHLSLKHFSVPDCICRKKHCGQFFHWAAHLAFSWDTYYMALLK